MAGDMQEQTGSQAAELVELEGMRYLYRMIFDH